MTVRASAEELPLDALQGEDWAGYTIMMISLAEPGWPY